MKKTIKNNATNFDKVKVAKEKLKAIKGGNHSWEGAGSCIYSGGELKESTSGEGWPAFSN